jgi:hypothetical protein
MRRMPDDEPTPVERTGLPRSTTFFRPSTPSRAMRTCCSSWGTTPVARTPPAGGKHLFMAAFCLTRQALVTDHGQNTGIGRVQ